MSIHVFYRRNLVNKICQKLLNRENHRFVVRIVLLTDKNFLLVASIEVGDFDAFRAQVLCLPRVEFEVMGVMCC